MSENPKKFKSKYQLKLLDEKRAFVVIALTDKFSLAGKAAAANALAHYDSRKGYAYVSVPTMAGEAGYSATSTKTINKGLEEMQAAGAFEVRRTKGGARKVHHICPNMAWFRAEYQLLRKSGRIGEDEFADLRDEDQEDDNSGPQPEMKSGSAQEKSGSEQQKSGPQQEKSGCQLDKSGSGPDEEEQKKRTIEEDQQKRTNLRGAPASGERGQDGSSGDDGPQRMQANDNQLADWPTDWSDKFWNDSPQRKNVAATEKALIAIAKSGVKFESILIAARRRFKMENVGYYRDPVKWLADEPWRDNHKPVPKKAESANRPAI
ncbi:hypothetical protein [Bradyrhizobium sp. RDM4]|uniref:hypothetical protein n=1 Tax=Bradyrhizobium sp. RDM4 TaxID=3378765 RepID=UPI0038FCFEB7